MPLARASELDRLLACPGAAILPHTLVKSDRSKDAANWGTAIHTWKETGALPANTRDARLFAKKLAATGVDRTVLWPATGEHEVALAFNVVTGVARRCVVPVGEVKSAYQDKWKAGFDDQWVTGTLDYVHELVGAPWVDDLKTGRFAHPKDYEAQQSFYVLAWGVVTYGEITESRSTITHWPRYPTTITPQRQGGIFAIDYLQHFWDRLHALRENLLRLRLGEPAAIVADLHPGDHCTFCPSRPTCPKHTT